MKENKRNIHDIFFKKVFSNMKVTKEFLENYLPADILNLLDLNNIQRQNDTFIDKTLEQYFTDTLYSIKLGDREAYLYILFEHKSYIDKGISFQLLEYIAKIYRKHRKDSPSGKVPVVIPIVIYHGESNWKQPLNLLEYMDIDLDKESCLLPYIPNFTYKFYDVIRMKREELHGTNLLLAVLIALKLKGKDKGFSLEEILRRFDSVGHEDDEIFQVLCEYMVKMLEDDKQEEFFFLMDNLEFDRKEEYMTLAQAWEKEKGIEKEKFRTANNLLKMNLDLHIIAQATELPLEEIEKLNRKLKN